jgi:hypothetical protein
MPARKVSSARIASPSRSGSPKGSSARASHSSKGSSKVASKAERKNAPRETLLQTKADEVATEPRVGNARATTKKKMGQSPKPALLSGGNPQVAKGDGDGPVQAYIAAMPEWKCLLGRRLDAIVETAVPGVRKAIKWNSPFYGVSGQGWFLSFHCFTKYVKVAFLRGASLSPPPPGVSKHKETRYLDVSEADELDEAQLITWLEQSAALPGWDGGSPRLNGGIPL